MGDLSSRASTPGERRVRVALVDDTDAIRRLVRMHLELDGRFEIVGEATDGVAAIDLAARSTPDLLILDRQMPRLTGLEVIPRIREVSPRTVVVLYTSDIDTWTYQAAIAAGALDVVLKNGDGDDLVDALADLLLRHIDAEADRPTVKVGPLPSSAALAWIDNACTILAAIRDHPDVLDTPVDDGVLDGLDRFLRVWRDIASASDVFVWVARARPGEVGALIRAFAAINRVPADRLGELGCKRPEGEAATFLDALTSAILAAVQQHNAGSELAVTLRRQWGDGGGEG
ncbi:MAG TPA: response regulator [Acidimicrobiales bacterium]|nr:response regulator [Acidimicrobiales bacterium]